VITAGTGQVDGDQPALLLAQVGCHGLHLAELQRYHDGLLGKPRQGLPGGGVHGGVVVAVGAVPVENLLPDVGQRQLVGVAHGRRLQRLRRVVQQQKTGTAGKGKGQQE
jgi:hypothetical protein